MPQQSRRRPTLARRPVLCALGLALAALPHAALRAQQAAPATTPAAAPVPGPAVGDQAPDFTLRGATRYGILRDSIRLSDFRGQTVVIAFFYKARTKG